MSLAVTLNVCVRGSSISESIWTFQGLPAFSWVPQRNLCSAWPDVVQHLSPDPIPTLHSGVPVSW